MPKRFTATEKWSKEWFCKLSPKNKLMLQYLWDNCDHAGIWDVNLSEASRRIGFKYNYQQTLIELNSKIVQIDHDKWYMIGFCEFQYQRFDGVLNSENKAHLGVIRRLSKFGLIDENNKIKGATKPLILGAKEQDKDKELVKVKEQEQGGKARSLSLNEITEFCLSLKLPSSDAEYLWHKWEGNGWKNGNQQIKDWKATIRSWQSAKYLPSQKNGLNGESLEEYNMRVLTREKK